MKDTDTILFKSKKEVPPDKKVTCASFVCDYRLLKNNLHRVRIEVGGDRLDYQDDATSPAANLLKTKLLLNNTISDAHKGARFMSADIKHHFLATPMKDLEFMKVICKCAPEDMRVRHNLDSLVTSDNKICIKIQKGMPGLKQASILAYKHLKNNLEPFGCAPAPGTIGL